MGTTNDTLPIGKSPESSEWPKNPWISIWTNPRQTIRDIINVDPKRHVVLLAILAGISWTLQNLSNSNFGDAFSISTITFFTLFAGSIGGIFSIYIGAALLSWLGEYFEGKASQVEVRAAIVWSSLPIIAVMVL